MPENDRISAIDALEIPMDEVGEKSRIKVIGVGGGGGNAANYMYDKKIYGVDFVVCNTDSQALCQSNIATKIMLGEKGLGAGNKPEIGRLAAVNSLDKIREMLDDDTEMVFVTAGMGGGTGTGAAPVIAEAAKEKGILTIGIVTIPFSFEGPNRMNQAISGLKEMRSKVDAIIVITNERIKELYGDLPLSKAFDTANDVLATAARGIAEIITVTGNINVDLNDVRTVMSNSGDALMGSAMASGENRAHDAIEKALQSPLLINTNLRCAKDVLMNISSSHDSEVKMDELEMITCYVQDMIDSEHGANLIWGATYDDSLGDNLNVTIVVTGMNITDDMLKYKSTKKAEEVKPRPLTMEERYLGIQPTQNIAVAEEKAQTEEQRPTPEEIAAALAFYKANKDNAGAMNGAINGTTQQNAGTPREEEYTEEQLGSGGGLFGRIYGTQK